MLEYIQSPQFYQFFDNHPERVFVVILIACATIIALVAVVTPDAAESVESDETK